MKRTYISSFLFLFVLIIFTKAFVVDAYRIPTGSMENTLLPGDFIFVNKAAYNISTPVSIPLTNIPIPFKVLKQIASPQRNDVIVFDFPGMLNEFRPNPRIFFVKRVAGLPGDTVELKDQKVFVNSKILRDASGRRFNDSPIAKGKKDYRIYPPDKNWNSDNYGPIYIPKKGDVIKLDTKNIRYWGNLINREFDKKVVATEGSVITIKGKPVREYTFSKNYYFVLGDNREESMDSRYWGFVPEDYIIGKAVLIYWSTDPSVFSIEETFKSIRWSRIFTKIK